MLNEAAAPTMLEAEVIAVNVLLLLAVPVILIVVGLPLPSTASILITASLVDVTPPINEPSIVQVSEALYPEPVCEILAL